MSRQPDDESGGKPVSDDARARLRYALETARMAEELWQYVFPPWRWRKWWRLSREVRQRLKAQRDWVGR